MIKQSTIEKLAENTRDALRSALSDVFIRLTADEKSGIKARWTAAGHASWGKWRDSIPTDLIRYILWPNWNRSVPDRFIDVIQGTFHIRPGRYVYTKFTNVNTGTGYMSMSNADLGNTIINVLHEMAPTASGNQGELIDEIIGMCDKYGKDSGTDMASAKAVFTLWAGIHLKRDKPASEIGSLGLPVPTLNEDQQKIADAIMGRSGVVLVAVGAAEVKPLEAPKLDQGMAAAINAILGQATGGKLTDINVVFGKLTDVTNALAAKDKELAETRMKLAMRPAATAITVAATGVEPNGKTKEVVLADVFTPTGGAREKALEFKVPAFEWDAAHPDVPEIDTDYQIRPELVATLGMAMLNDDRVWITGDTGTGKTTGVEQFAARLGFPVHRVNLDSDVMREDLLGGIELNGGATKYQEGILPRVMVKPGYLILDEIDRAKPDLGYVLTQFLESGKGGLRLLADGGRMVYPHPLFRIVATANTVGMGDESGHYQGARHQSLAILNRFNKWATVDYLDKEAEAKLLMAKAPGLSKQIADRLVNFAKEIRAGFRQGAFMYVVSPRNLITLARDFMFMSSLTDGNAAMEQVTRNTILNSLTLQDKVAVREIASRTLGVSRK
jgi:cobaltochelatase CobS